MSLVISPTELVQMFMCRSYSADQGIDMWVFKSSIFYTKTRIPCHDMWHGIFACWIKWISFFRLLIVTTNTFTCTVARYLPHKAILYYRYLKHQLTWQRPPWSSGYAAYVCRSKSLVIVTAVGSSLARVTCETSQVLLAGGQVVFLEDAPFSPHPKSDCAQTEWNNLDGNDGP